jgi:hypothetical protein
MEEIYLLPFFTKTARKVLEETSHTCQNPNQYEYFGYPAASGPQFGETSN